MPYQVMFACPRAARLTRNFVATYSLVSGLTVESHSNIDRRLLSMASLMARTQAQKHFKDGDTANRHEVTQLQVGGPFKDIVEDLVDRLDNIGHKSVHLERLKSLVDPEKQIQGMEDELREEIAAALRETANKVDFAILRCEEAALNVSMIRKTKGNSCNEAAIRNAIKVYNTLCDKAEEARRNLIIHRQACGFRTDNYKVCLKFYPIPKKIS